MSYLADLLLVQLLALCSFGGPSPRATTKKRQHYSKSNNLKCGQEAEFTNPHDKFQHRANRICPSSSKHALHVAALADATADHPNFIWLRFYWPTSFRCTAVWVLLSCDTLPVPKSTSTLYQSCRVGRPWCRPGVRNEQCRSSSCCLRAIYHTGLFFFLKKKEKGLVPFDLLARIC